MNPTPITTRIKCEHCELPARHLIFDRGPRMFMLACDEYENDVARLEGEEELEELDFDFATTQEIVNFLNARLQEDDQRYSELLKSYTDLREKRAGELEGDVQALEERKHA